MKLGECLLPYVPETFMLYKDKTRQNYIMVLHIAMYFVVQSS